MPKFCTRCGAPLLEDSLFCTSCGAKVTVDNVPTEASVPPQPAPQTPVEAPVPPQPAPQTPAETPAPQQSVPQTPAQPPVFPQAAQTGSVAPYTQGFSATYASQPYARPKKKKRGLLITLIAAGVLLIAGLALLFGLRGCKKDAAHVPDFEAYGIKTDMEIGVPQTIHTCAKDHGDVSLTGTVTVQSFTRETASPDTVAYGQTLGFDFSGCDVLRLDAYLCFTGDDANAVRQYGVDIQTHTEDYYDIAKFDNSSTKLNDGTDAEFTQYTISVGEEEMPLYVWHSYAWDMPAYGNVGQTLSFKAIVPAGYDGLVIGWRNAALAMKGEYLYEDYSAETAAHFCFFRLADKQGTKRMADFEKRGFLFNLAVGTPVTYTTICNDEALTPTTGTLTLESCTKETASESTIAFGAENGMDLSGYEIYRIHSSVDFRDEAALQAGAQVLTLFLNFYDIEGAADSGQAFTDTQGNSYDRYEVPIGGQIRYIYHWSSWEAHSEEIPDLPGTYRSVHVMDDKVLVPAGYDGEVIGFANRALYLAEDARLVNVYDPSQVFLYRLQ